MAPLHVGALEVETEAGQAGQDRLVGGQGYHLDRVDVALVDRPRDVELGAHTEVDGVQPVTAELVEGRLPRDLQLEEDLVAGALLEPEGTSDAVAVEGHHRVVLAVAGLHLDPGHQGQLDEVHVHTGMAARDVDDPVHHSAGVGPARPQCRRNLGAPAEHPLEHARQSNRAAVSARGIRAHGLLSAK